MILGNEIWPLLAGRLDLVLQPRPKDVSPIRLRVPSPAALLALIETGPGKDVGCRPAETD